MQLTQPFALHHSWPLTERQDRFALGTLLPIGSSLDTGAPALLRSFEDPAVLAAYSVGRWSCTLASGALHWSGAVYDLFGFPQGASVTRAEALAVYTEESRAAVERLREHAIRHRRGFTIDVELRPHDRASRWMRLIAEPVVVDGQVATVTGLKIAIDPPQT